VLDAVFLPRAVPQREHARAEHVEEGAGRLRVLSVLRQREQAFRHVQRQRAVRAQQAHEAGREAIAVGFRRGGLDLAGRERERKAVGEAQVADERAPFGNAALVQRQQQEAHGLHEVEALGLGQQAGDQVHPPPLVRGAQAMISRPVWCDTTCSRVKQFSWPFRAK